MALDEIHVGDIGTVFTITIMDGTSIVDISTATTKTITFKSPDGTSSDKTASFVTDGTDGQIQYTTIADDLSDCGLWRLQAYIVTPSGSWHTDVSEFKVYSNL